MRPALVLLGLLTAGAVATPAVAGAWTKGRGEAQIILKLESMRADRGYGPDGALVSLGSTRRDQAVSLFAEYGLTDRLTLQLKGDLQKGEDAFVEFEGRGPIEIGLTWQVWRDDKAAVSLYAGYADGGEGRNAGYAPPGEGDSDWELRVSAGRSFAGGEGRWAPDRTFVEVQAARRMRDGLPDETRVDLTLGAHFGRDWLVLGQVYAGETDDDGARWVSVETSVVRHFGSWSLQGGWRRAVAGRETPAAEGPVIGLWRRF